MKNIPDFVEELFPGAEKQRQEQMGVNFDFLLSAINEIHACLCPGSNGTWQERTMQAIEAARRVRNKR